MKSAAGTGSPNRSLPQYWWNRYAHRWSILLALVHRMCICDRLSFVSPKGFLATMLSTHFTTALLRPQRKIFSFGFHRVNVQAGKLRGASVYPLQHVFVCTSNASAKPMERDGRHLQVVDFLGPKEHSNHSRCLGTASSSFLQETAACQHCGDYGSGDSSKGILFTLCHKCLGNGKRKARQTKKARRLRQQLSTTAIQQPDAADLLATPPRSRLVSCRTCSGTGLLPLDEVNETDGLPTVDNRFSVAIVGGGIGGFALALALQHRNVPCTVYERDDSFDCRRQGYGLTMQQGTRALRALGLFPSGGQNKSFSFGIHSKRHIVHKPDGTEVGRWGMRVWGRLGTENHRKKNRRQNVHVPRQTLRKILLDRLTPGTVWWGHHFVGYTDSADGVKMRFRCGDRNDFVTHRATVLAGADGIWSAVRRQKIGDLASPLRYLGCIVILGIAPSPASSDLMDAETVFQTADGTSRIYVMPFAQPCEGTGTGTGIGSADTCHSSNKETPKNNNASPVMTRGETMWQLSFPMTEKDAQKLALRGSAALKDEALTRCGSWHDPIPFIISSTPPELVTGYPVYDREVLSEEVLRFGCQQEKQNEGDFAKRTESSRVTLLGDAAHPMSPFKGQGANQALLDAVSLARALYKVFLAKEQRKIVKDTDIISRGLAVFEGEMLQRSSVKVRSSAMAADFLHTNVAVMEGNVTRGAKAVTMLEAATDTK